MAVLLAAAERGATEAESARAAAAADRDAKVAACPSRSTAGLLPA